MLTGPISRSLVDSRYARVVDQARRRTIEGCCSSGPMSRWAVAVWAPRFVWIPMKIVRERYPRLNWA